MEYDLEFVATMGHLMTGFGTIILAFLLYKTFRHLEASTRAANIQTEYKLRPWVGPTGAIQQLFRDAKKTRIEITIKNFGDLPATNVIAYSIASISEIAKDEVHKSSKVDLGPVLPNMEKHYWFDIPNEVIDEAIKSKTKISGGLLFEYPLSYGNSEYGMISEIDPETFKFVHKEMWVHSPSMMSS